MVADALRAAGAPSPTKIIDVASGPGEPALTMAKSYPEASVLVTDAAEAMLSLADVRIAEQGVGERVTTCVMDLNDFSPVSDAHKPADLVTAQFALMFTEDLPGSLEEINGVLCEGGILVGTVWEDFFLLPLIRDTMTAVLGSAPPPPPINPLSLKDVDLVDGALADAGFTTFGRHNETATIDINLGPYKSDDTIKCTLIPVTPSLAELQEKGEHGDDVFGTAMEAMKTAIVEHGMISPEGDVVLTTSTYRYFVARK